MFRAHIPAERGAVKHENQARTSIEFANATVVETKILPHTDAADAALPAFQRLLIAHRPPRRTHLDAARHVRST